MTKGKITLVAVLVLLAFALGVLVGGFAFGTKDKKGTDGTDMTSETTTEAETTLPTEPEVTEPETTAPTPVKDKYDDIIETMTLEEKVAQMMIVSCHQSVDIEDAAAFGVGGICFYYFSFEGKTADEVRDMIGNYQALSKIPMLTSTDEEGGTVCRVSLNENLRAVPFYSPSELYEEGGFDLVRSDTEEKADLLLSLGINVNLAPVCDVPLSEDNYIYDRCFSLDADETAEYVSLVVSTMEDKGIGSVMKHFPGYGGSIDTHQYVSYDKRDYSAFENGDFKPFEAGIREGGDCVMVSHNIVTCMDPDMPSSLSKPVHDILRNELGFEGVIMTDDMSMDGITEFTDGESAAVAAVVAGNDMLACEDYRGATEAVIRAVNDGTVSEEQINQSVRRILIWKDELGILG